MADKGIIQIWPPEAPASPSEADIGRRYSAKGHTRACD